MTPIADVFRKLRTPKFLFQRTFRQATWEAPQKILKFEPHHLYHIYWSLCRILNWRKPLLVICKVLTMFVNIFTADDKYSLLNRDDLRQPIQMQLPQKEKTFSEFVSEILQAILHFKHFQKIDAPDRWCISEVTGPKHVAK